MAWIRKGAPAVLAGLVLALLGAAAPAYATTTTTNVDCTNDPDSGGGTALQSAIANASPGDTLLINGDCVETAVDNGDGPTVYTIDGKNLTLEAAPGDDAELYPAGNRLGRVMEVTGGAQVTLKNLYFRLSNYEASSDQDLSVSGDGGGLYVTSGSTVTVTDDMFTGNEASNGGSGSCNTPSASAGLGGGVYNAGTVSITNSYFTGNSTGYGCSSAGGGLYNADGARATVSQSNFDGNQASAGGAIYNDGTMTVDAINASDGGGSLIGSGIDNDSQGTMSVTNSTIYGNEVDSGCVNEDGHQAFGGGVYNLGSIALTADTINGNATGFEGAQGCTGDAGAAGGGVYNAGSATVAATILAGNTNKNASNGGTAVDPDCDNNGGTITDEGYNLVGDPTGCTAFTQSTDQSGSSGSPLSPDLGSFGDGFNGQLSFYDTPGEGYGGPPVGPAPDSAGNEQFTNGSEQFTTWSLLPNSGSPVIGKIPASTCDQLLGAGPTDQRGVDRPQGGACEIGAVELQSGPPVAQPDTYSVPENGTITIDAAHAVLSNDSTPTGGKILIPYSDTCVGSSCQYNTVQSQQGVDVVLHPDGSFTYTAPSGFTGRDSFTYEDDDTTTNDASQTVTVTLNVGGSTATTTTLTSSANPAAVGQSVTYTVNVSPAPDGGTVAFSDGGTQIPGCTAAAVTGGVATCQQSYPASGSHVISAVYSGNTDFVGSDSNTLTETVTRTGTATSLSSSLNPVSPGHAVTYTASVTPAPDGGNLAFTDGGAVISGCASVAVVSGRASCQTTYAAIGSHVIGALYSGDGAFGSSQAPALTEQVIAGASSAVGATATALAASPFKVATGQPVSLKATVSPSPGGGTIEFLADGNALPGCGAVSLTSGTATCHTAFATPATELLQAAYSGDAHFAGSQSSVVSRRILSSTLLVGAPSARAGLVRYKLSCAAGSGGCLTTGTLTTVETVNGHAVTGVIAKSKGKQRSVVIGTKQMKIKAGKTAVVTIRLDRTGQQLLSSFHDVPVSLKIVMTVLGRRSTVASRKLKVAR